MRARMLLGLLVPIALACNGESAPADDTLAAASPDGQDAGAMPDSGDTAGALINGRDTLLPGASGERPGQPAPVTSAPIAGADTALGEVHIMGTAIDNRVVIQTSAGPIGVAGDLTETIRRLQGIEIWVQGPLSIAMGRVIPPRQITVERFEVRKVAGMPVVDGTLRQADGEWTVTTASGTRTQLSSVPDDLRQLDGRRVWIALRDGGAVQSFGIVE